MELSVVQLILLVLLSYITGIDPLFAMLQTNKPIIAGMFAGLIMGDLQTGLLVGATLQLMVLGVGTYGGASIPDFASGAIIGTVFGVLSGKGLEFAIGLSVPVGLMLVQLDVLARFVTVFFLHRIEKHVEADNIKAINREAILSTIPFGLSRALPVGLALIFGDSLVKTIVDFAPDWLMGGLKIAGGVLPVVGIAILLRYLPVKKFFPFLLVGFFTAAYLNVPMMGAAILGAAMALIYYKVISVPKPQHVVTTGSQMAENEFEVGDDEDEL